MGGQRERERWRDTGKEMEREINKGESERGVRIDRERLRER